MEEGKERKTKRKHIRDEEIIRIIARNVTAYRKSAQMTQRQLAFESGLTNAQIGTIETASGNPNASQLAAIAKALEILPYLLMKPMKDNEVS